jgi:hypothetical protein
VSTVTQITGFTAAPPGWRVVWLDLDCGEQGAIVTAPIAGWITGIDGKTGETFIEAAAHCAGLRYGTAPSTPWVYPVSEAEEYPGGVWKILGPGEPEPAPEEAKAEAERREASYEARQRRREAS